MFNSLIIASWSTGAVLLVFLMVLFLRIRFALVGKEDIEVGKIIVDTFLIYSLWSILTIGTITILLITGLDIPPWFILVVGAGWVIIPSIGIIRLAKWRYKEEED